MWIAKIEIKHDCIIGNRCEKFNVIDTGISFNIHQEGGFTFSPQIHTVHGEEENVKKFLDDLKRDRRVTNLEIEGNSFFCIEVRKESVPSTFKTEKLIFVKPVVVDKRGYETWEMASWKRSNLIDFISRIRKDIKNVKILKIQQTRLTDVYYPRLMPKLSRNQRRAIELAFEKGYYDFPRKTDMDKLAKAMNISTPTFWEHLKKAEKKLMPDVIESLE